MNESIETVNHPKHYNQHPSGIECINLVESFTFNFGNALKYLWRAGLKSSSNVKEDYRKAKFYLEREIKRLSPWTQFDQFNKEYYSVTFDTLYSTDICKLCEKVIESDRNSLLSKVLIAYMDNKNPLDAYNKWIADNLTDV